MDDIDALLSDILGNGPSPDTLFIVLSRMKKEGRLSRVIEECQKALEVYPEEIRIRRLLAETLLESGKVDQAEHEVEKVITMLNGFISAYSLQAGVLIRQGREEEAARVLKFYLGHRPDDQEARDLLESLEWEEELPIEPESIMEEEAPRPVQRETDLPDIATPTLAEIYFDQGRIKEALETYEKVISQRPDDNKSRQRLDELKAIMAQGPVTEDMEEDRVRQKKEKMIALLESWLAGIREQSKTGLSLN